MRRQGRLIVHLLSDAHAGISQQLGIIHYPANHLHQPTNSPINILLSPLSCGRTSHSMHKLGYEVQTSGTMHGVPINTPLPHTHPQYQEACFECHHLGHIHIHCQWYVCPICKVNQPGHHQHHCTLNHHSACSSSSSFLSSSHPHPIPPPHSCRMTTKNSSVHCHNLHSHSPPHTHFPSCSCSPLHPHSPLKDFEYDNGAIANIMGSPISSWTNFDLHLS